MYSVAVHPVEVERFSINMYNQQPTKFLMFTNRSGIQGRKRRVAGGALDIARHTDQQGPLLPSSSLFPVSHGPGLPVNCFASPRLCEGPASAVGSRLHSLEYV